MWRPSSLPSPDARGGCDVNAGGVADGGRHRRQRSGVVLDVDNEIDWHLRGAPAYPRRPRCGSALSPNTIPEPSITQAGQK